MAQDKTYVDLPMEDDLPDLRSLLQGKGEKKMSRKEAKEYSKVVDPELPAVQGPMSIMGETPRNQVKLHALPGDDMMPYEKEANRKVTDNVADLAKMAIGDLSDSYLPEHMQNAVDVASLLDPRALTAKKMLALIPLMSRKTQDKFIEDYARKMANHYVGTLSGPTGDVVRSLDGAYHDRVGLIDDISAELEKRMKALPEKQQDAVVATLMTIDPKKFTFGGDQSFARSLYNQGHNPTLINISSMDASTPEQFAKTFLHEVSHPMDNQFDPIYAYQRYVSDELPENIKTSKRSVMEGIGDEMSKEKIHTATMNSFGHPSNIAIPEEEHDRLLDIMPEETLTMVEDDFSMVPIPGTGKKWKSPGKKVYSHHEETYPYESQQKTEYEMAQSGLDPKSLPLKTRKNAARSIEGWANYTPAMSSEEAQKGTRIVLPKTSSKIDAILEKDPRRPFANKFVPSEYWGAEGERELLPEIDWSLYK